MKTKYFIIVVSGPIAGVFFGSMIWHKLMTRQIPSAVILNVAASVAIGTNTDFQGETNAPNTLVEFADFQCPPCIGQSFEIPKYLNKYGGKLRFQFRHYPLVKMHPYAMAAAIASEASRKQGTFWQAHDALFQKKAHLTHLDIEGAIHNLGIDSARYDRDQAAAKASVDQDMKTGDVLGVTGTPTFILCLADGRVLQLNGLAQIADYLSPTNPIQ